MPNWYLVRRKDGAEYAAFTYVGEAMNSAFELGAGSTVTNISERTAMPTEEPFYTAPEREYMIRTKDGLDYLHAPGEFECCQAARDQLGPGATVWKLGRDLQWTGVLVHTVPEVV